MSSHLVLVLHKSVSGYWITRPKGMLHDYSENKKGMLCS